MSGFSRRIFRIRLPSSASAPTMNGFVPTSRLAWPAFVGSPAEVSMDSPSMKYAAACSDVSFAHTGTTSLRRVMNTILLAFSRSMPSPEPLMNRRRTTPRPFEVSDVSRKSTLPFSPTAMFSYAAVGCVAAPQRTVCEGSRPSVLM